MSSFAHSMILSAACMIAMMAPVTSLPAQPGNTPVDVVRSSVPAPVQELRRHMLDAGVNALFFHNMDELFETRTVTRAGPVTQLPREDAAPPGVAFNGKHYSYEDFADASFTNALLIIREGRIIFEDYRNNTKADTRFIAFSMSKSITSMLIGLAIEQGHIRSVDDPVVRYVPELKGSGYDGATIRQLLQMRSGVDYEERYDFGENPSFAAKIHEHAIVQNTERFADRARTLTRKTKPGSRFNYATIDTAVLGRVLENATGQAISTYMSTNLWEPAGMEYSGYWIADGQPGVGRELNGMGYNAALRDFGRLGQMMLDGGKLNGRQILPERWVKEATAIKPFSGNDVTMGQVGYGYQWWKLDNDAGTYSAVGLQGQFIYIDPRSKTVIVKLSYFPPGPGGDEATAMTKAFFRAVTHWTPTR